MTDQERERARQVISDALGLGTINKLFPGIGDEMKFEKGWDDVAKITEFLISLYAQTKPSDRSRVYGLICEFLERIHINASFIDSWDAAGEPQ